MQEIIFTPSDFIAVINQTLEYAYPTVIIEGELSNFKISKNRWVYFDLKDEQASVRFFGTIYQLPGPLEDGLEVRVLGTPKLHPRFGFSITFQSILPKGEGSLKRAADILYKKLEEEGLFAPERKRLLPALPCKVGLITAADSAAAADFIKIVNERWCGLEISMIDVFVQGDLASSQLVSAIEQMTELSSLPEVLIITRGGGSAEDLAAFNDERVVRAIAASRIPTLVAIGHEVDISLAELAADQRASTPSNAAQLLVPDKKSEQRALEDTRNFLNKTTQYILKDSRTYLSGSKDLLFNSIQFLINQKYRQLEHDKRLIKIFDPKAVLQRGYAIVLKNNVRLRSIKGLKMGDRLSVQFSDGIIKTVVKQINSNHSGKQ